MSTTRREFLKHAGIAGVCVCAGSLSFLSSCATASKTTASVTETDATLSFSSSMFAGKNFTVVTSKKFEDPIFVGKLTDGSYTALLMNCTHRGCSLDVAKTEDKLVCPCHGSEFTVAGDVMKGPAKVHLQSFPVTADAGNVTVHLQ